MALSDYDSTIKTVVFLDKVDTFTRTDKVSNTLQYKTKEYFIYHTLSDQLLFLSKGLTKKHFKWE